MSWNTTTAPPGLATLTAVARDAAGNQTTSTAVVVAVLSTTVTVTVAWDANTEPGLAGYKVHYGTTTGVYFVTIDVGNVTTFPVPGLEAATLYFFSVTAYNASGDESGFSNEVSAIN